MSISIFYAPSTVEAAIGKALHDYRQALKADPDAKWSPYVKEVVEAFPRANVKEIREMMKIMKSSTD